MLSKDQQNLLNQLLATLSPEQKIWLAGYMQGLTGGSTAETATDPAKPRVEIYYATETGNSKTLALQVMKAVKASGFKVKNSAVNRLKPEDIPRDALCLFLASTHGEGDPPESAHKFFDLLKSARDNSLDNLQYAVLGLGDKSYEIFCGAAVNLDKHLARLGGKSLQDIALFDVDFAAHTQGWIEQTVANLNKLAGAGENAIPAFVPTEDILRTGKGYTRLEPVTGRVKHIVNLNDIDSDKETYHIEIEYEDDIAYACGDAAGIILPEGAPGADEAPRLYSIASSPAAHEGEIHLTVALATYKKDDGSIGHGVCSRYLADLKDGDTISFYISQNQLFKLPEDTRDIIMIGPGTGIAPFRSFVYERSERGASGRNWLLFGDRHMHCDFLYQAEWQEHLATDTLARIDLAFSRDQDHKIYVQDRLKENAAEVIAWLDGGANIYVCGAKDPMSKDVDAALIEILTAQKGIAREQAEDALAQLEEDGRYVKDVY